MTLREHILSSPETISDLAWAAEQRFREAEELLYTGRFTGAVYLFGLSVEMWLKLACFYFRGARPSTTVDSQLAPARRWMRANSPAVDPESYHSLLFWTEFLILLRSRQGSSMPSDLAGRLRHHVVSRIFEDWRIDMRYHALAIGEQQAWRVYNDAAWIRDHWRKLWR